MIRSSIYLRILVTNKILIIQQDLVEKLVPNALINLTLLHRAGY